MATTTGQSTGRACAEAYNAYPKSLPILSRGPLEVPYTIPGYMISV